MKNKKFIISLIFTIILITLAVFIWLYSFYVIQNKNDEVLSIRRKAAEEEIKLQNSNLIENSLANINKEKKKIDAVFLNKDNIINFIEDLEIVAGHTGATMELDNITTSDDGTKKPVAYFTLKGKFQQIFQYLALLENIPYSIVIRKLNIFQEDGKWQASFEVALNSFLEN